MRKLVTACFCLVAVAGSCEFLQAQNRIGDVPDAFFSAQRGRVVAHGHGGFRMRYGRGLTAEGAGVINTGITTLGPLLPTLLLGAAPVAVPASALGPAPGAAPANQAAPQAAPACEPSTDAPADTVLDALASPEERDKRLKNLDNMLLRLKPVVEGFGGKFEPGLPPTPTDSAGDRPSPLDPTSGGHANPPWEVPGPGAAPRAADLPKKAEAAQPAKPANPNGD